MWPDYPIKGFHLVRIPRRLTDVGLSNLPHQSGKCRYCNEVAVLSLELHGYGPAYLDRKSGCFADNAIPLSNKFGYLSLPSMVQE